MFQKTVCTFKRLKARKKYEYLAEKVYFTVFKHEVCTLKEIIESERGKYKKTVRVSYPESVQRDTKP